MKEFREFRHIPVLPAVDGPPPAPVPVWGGVQFPDDAPEWCFHMRGGRILSRRPPRLQLPERRDTLAGTYLYGGLLHRHFGHMIAEFMHRMWATELPGLRDAIPLFVVQKNRSSEGLVRAILELMRLPAPVFIDRPTDVERLIVAEPAKMLRSLPAPGYCDFLERCLGYLRSSQPRHPRRLAVLRGHQRTGRCIGERWLERYLETEGYFAFHPEDYPLRVQMEYYLDAEKVIFSEGSAIHLLDIMPPIQAEVAVLNRRGPDVAYYTLAGKCPALHMFDGKLLGHPSGDNALAAYGLSWVDMPRFLEFLHANRFVETLPLAQFFDDPDAVAEDLLSYLRIVPRFDKRATTEEGLIKQALIYLVRSMRAV